MSIIHWVPLKMLILLVMTSICIGIQSAAALWIQNWKQHAKPQNMHFSNHLSFLKNWGYLLCGDAVFLMGQWLYPGVFQTNKQKKTKKNPNDIYFIQLLYRQAHLQALKSNFHHELKLAEPLRSNSSYNPSCRSLPMLIPTINVQQGSHTLLCLSMDIKALTS